MNSIATPFSSEPLQRLSVPRDSVLPLENGDRLTRAEFMRRWDAMPNLKRAELIEGIVFMAAAVRIRQHGRPYRILVGLLDRYITSTPGLDGGADASVILDEDNMPQPDVCLFMPAEVGGQSRINDEGYLEGPPDLVAEVAASSASIDLNLKLHAYRRSGVREYLVWRVLDKAVDWFVLREGRFDPLPLDADGVYRSTVCPGLWLDPTALVALRSKRLHAVLQQGLGSAEHQEFVQRLAPYALPED